MLSFLETANKYLDAEEVETSDLETKEHYLEWKLENDISYMNDTQNPLLLTRLDSKITPIGFLNQLVRATDDIDIDRISIYRDYIRKLSETEKQMLWEIVDQKEMIAILRIMGYDSIKSLENGHDHSPIYGVFPDEEPEFDADIEKSRLGEPPVRSF